ncbi:hypothetical protein Tco_0365811 [Tanacetum coccineum]
MIQSWGHQSTHRRNIIHNHSIGQTISLVILKEKVKHSVEDMVSITTHITLPTAWTGSQVMLMLPADPGLWSEVISRWESITINRLNNQTWSDNKAKLAFVENLLGESEKLMWQHNCEP